MGNRLSNNKDFENLTEFPLFDSTYKEKGKISSPNTQVNSVRFFVGLNKSLERTVSVFEYTSNKDKSEKEGVNFFESGQKNSERLRSLKGFPGVLEHLSTTFINGAQPTGGASTTVDNKGNILNFMTINSIGNISGVVVAVEGVKTLKDAVRNHDLELSEKLYGIQQIGRTLKLLHQKNILHNSVNNESVFISLTKTDKNYKKSFLLGNFENTFINNSNSNINNSNKDIFYKDVKGFFQIAHYLLSEEKNNHSVDEDILTFLKEENEKNEKNEDFDDSRGKMQKFLSNRIFEEDRFCQVMLFLDDFENQDDSKKSEFFMNLKDDLKNFMNQSSKNGMVNESNKNESNKAKVLGRRVLVRILSQRVFCSNNKEASVFYPWIFARKDKGGMLDKEEYTKYVTKFISVAVKSKDISVRKRLLENVEYFLWNLTNSNSSSASNTLIFEEIIPRFAEGVYEIDDTLSKMTLESFSTLVRWLSSYDNVFKSSKGKMAMNGLIVPILHHFATFSSKKDDKIEDENKENSRNKLRCFSLMLCVQLWNIKNISKDILLSAIVEAFFDKSHHITIHIINCLTINKNHTNFSNFELAKLILPLLCSCSIHANADVRAKSISLMKLILEDLEQYNNNSTNSPENSSSNTSFYDSNELRKKLPISPLFPESSRLPISRRQIFK